MDSNPSAPPIVAGLAMGLGQPITTGQPTIGAQRPAPADNHVHSQWSHDTGPRASMAAACARAVRLGLPAVAFTEHLDFTEWGPDDPVSGTGITRMTSGDPVPWT